MAVVTTVSADGLGRSHIFMFYCPPLLLVMTPPFLSLTTITLLPLINQAISFDGPASDHRARFPRILSRFRMNPTLV